MDYHHMAHPLELEGDDRRANGDELCINLYLEMMKGYAISAIIGKTGDAMRLPYSVFYYFSALEQFNKEPLTELESFKQYYEKNNLEKMDQGFYELIEQIGQQGMLDLFMSLETKLGVNEFSLAVAFHEKYLKTGEEKYLLNTIKNYVIAKEKHSKHNIRIWGGSIKEKLDGIDKRLEKIYKQIKEVPYKELKK